MWGVLLVLADATQALKVGCSLAGRSGESSISGTSSVARVCTQAAHLYDCCGNKWCCAVKYLGCPIPLNSYF